MSEDQRDVVAFLKDPFSYGEGENRVELLETHVSIIFLAGGHAYKLKRAVKFPYLDFSTAELRRRACAAELALNRRTAPGLYEEVRGLFRAANGGIGFAPNGAAVDWVVVMRRFDNELLFDTLAQGGRLTARMMDELADHIAAFHSGAGRRFDHGGATDTADLAELQHRCLADSRDTGFSQPQIDSLLAKWRQALATVAVLLDQRRAAGKVRHCHGDLHLRNICLFDGKPTLFDCLEFSEGLASIDVLYDLAFLLMDLDHRGLGCLANRVLNRYLDRTEEDDGLAAMPLFLSLRAAIRAHVIASSVDGEGARDHSARAKTAAETRRYIELAQRFLEPQPARLVAIGGVSGTGKSTLAAGLAPELGPSPGARVLRSDVTRKLLLGVDPETRLPATAYTRAISDRVYDLLRHKAAIVLAAGYSVIIDAVALRPEERSSFAEVARTAGVAFSGLWLEGSAETMTGRIRARRGDPSDATPAILAEQLRHDAGPIDWSRIDASGKPADCLAAARRALAATDTAATG